MNLFKKPLAIVLTLMIILSCAVVASAVESKTATGSQGSINFNASGWKNFSEVYCHIWKRGSEAFYSWQSRKEKCKGSGANWSYDVSGIDLQDGEDYCVIFSTNIGQQTYDATFSKSCIGDTLKLTGNKIENPFDSAKRADEAVWTKNSGSYGPHLALTSIGNIVGEYLCPHESAIEVIGDWLSGYYKSAEIKNKVVVLANAFKRFGIKTAQNVKDIFDYICNKETDKDESFMKELLSEAFVTAYPGKTAPFTVFSLKKDKATVYVHKTYKIQFEKNSGGLTYKSSDKSVADVKNGKIYPNKTGKVTISVSKGNISKKLKVTVKNPYLKNKKITIKKGSAKKIKIIGKNNKTIYYSKNKKIAKVSSSGKVKALKKGTTKINILTNGTSIEKVTSLETGKTKTTMHDGVLLVLTVKVK